MIWAVMEMYDIYDHMRKQAALRACEERYLRDDRYDDYDEDDYEDDYEDEEENFDD